MHEPRPSTILCGLPRVAILLLTMAFGFVHPEAKAQGTIEVVPESIELPTEGTVDALVLFRNPTQTAFQDIQLSTFTHAGVRVDVQEPEQRDLLPQGALAWQLKLSSSQQGPVPGKVHLRIDYVQTRNDARISSIETAALQVNRSTLDVNVQVETALKSLMEFRPGIVYLKIRNASPVPIRVTGVEPSGPDFLSFRRRDSTSVPLAPNETHALTYTVSALDRVRSGKHLLVFKIAFDHIANASTWKGSTVVTHEVDVGILGESEILTAIGVPSFLFLPGFLILITLGFLWEKEVLREKTETGSTFPLKAKTAEFWVAAVILSILVALLYPLVTGWFGPSVNYLEGYGLADVVWVWSASVLVTFAGYVVFVAGRNGWRKWQQRKQQQKTPSADDSPIEMLQKLDKQELVLHLPRVEVNLNGQPQNAFVIEPRTQDQEYLWVGPSIVYRWTDESDADFADEVNEAQAERGDPQKLAELFNEGERRNLLTVEWGHVGQLTKPRQVPVTDIQGDKDPRAIVQPA